MSEFKQFVEQVVKAPESTPECRKTFEDLLREHEELGDDALQQRLRVYRDKLSAPVRAILNARYKDENTDQNTNFDRALRGLRAGITTVQHKDAFAELTAARQVLTDKREREEDMLFKLFWMDSAKVLLEAVPAETIASIKSAIVQNDHDQLWTLRKGMTAEQQNTYDHFLADTYPKSTLYNLNLGKNCTINVRDNLKTAIKAYKRLRSLSYKSDECDSVYHELLKKMSERDIAQEIANTCDDESLPALWNIFVLVPDNEIKRAYLSRLSTKLKDKDCALSFGSVTLTLKDGKTKKRALRILKKFHSGEEDRRVERLCDRLALAS